MPGGRLSNPNPLPDLAIWQEQCSLPEPLIIMVEIIALMRYDSSISEL
jgi:hypothetical protein